MARVEKGDLAYHNDRWNHHTNPTGNSICSRMSGIYSPAQNRIPPAHKYHPELTGAKTDDFQVKQNNLQVQAGQSRSKEVWIR